MGEVYRARDPRLGREVAVKILPASLDTDADHLRRFAREARAVAALNHPNILSVYDIGSHEDIHYIVTELLQGETLRDTLSRGALPPRRATEYAIQIAQGLSAAHDKGIVHRDLKPENLFITKDGGVKILDFGLAKEKQTTTLGDGDADTLAGTVRTSAGTILGTVGYMSPEQVRGEDVDHRSDLFSFGAVMYEMFSGSRAFKGDTPVETLSAILRDEPAELPRVTPPLHHALDRTIRHCLEKNSLDRFQSARDLRFQLELAAEGLFPESESTASHITALRPKWLIPPVVAISLIAGAILAIWFFPEERGLDQQLHFTPVAADAGPEQYPKISPDGYSIAYVRPVNGIWQLFVRSQRSGVAAQLTNSAISVILDFWSADSRRIYFRLDGELQSISASGGSPQRVLADAYTPLAISPDGNTIALLDFPNQDMSKYELLASSPPGAPAKKLAAGSTPPGVIFSEMAFSPDGRKLMVTNLGGTAWFFEYPSGKVILIPWLKQTQTIDWLPDSRHVVVEDVTSRKLVLVDTETPASHLLLAAHNPLRTPTVSRDGTRIAFSTGLADSDVYEFSLEGRKLQPLLESPLAESAADWSPRGDRFTYALASSGIWLRNADATGATLLVNNQHAYGPTFAPNGLRVAFRVGDSINTVLATGGEPIPLTERAAPLSETRGGVCWSPDSEWLAYPLGLNPVNSELWKTRASGEGRPERVAMNVRHQYGTSCSWAPDGRWIAYPGQDGIYVVSPDGKEDHVVIKGLSTIARFAAGGKLIAVLQERDSTERNLGTYEVPSGRRVSSARLDVPPDSLVTHLSLHPNGQRITVTVLQEKYNIWMMEGFARPTTGWRRFLQHWTLPSAEQSSR